MGVAHLGGNGPLPVVLPRNSSPKTEAVAGAVDPAAPPEAGKQLPDPAKGVAKGLTTERILARWDRNHDGVLTADDFGKHRDRDKDGVLTAADFGPRWGAGILAALLKLQEAPSSDTGSAKVTPPSP